MGSAVNAYIIIVKKEHYQHAFSRLKLKKPMIVRSLIF